MPNYYDILKIPREASHAQVKAAFRKLAKEHHPDYHPPERGEWAHSRMQEILRAYEVLIDDEKRAIYDRTISHIDELRAPSLREKLKKRRDPRARCRLILLDLLEGRGTEALNLYEELRAADPSFNLKDHMPLSDYLDCEFLLAEEYERQNRTEEAFEMYSRLYREDKRYNYFKHFREEILLRMRNLMVQLLRAEEELPLVLKSLSETMKDALPRRERAFIYKKMAESFIRAGDRRLARLNLISALLLNPKLGGAKKIRARLDVNRHLLAGASSCGARISRA